MDPDVPWLAQPVIYPFGLGARGEKRGKGELGLWQDDGVGNGDDAGA